MARTATDRLITPTTTGATDTYTPPRNCIASIIVPATGDITLEVYSDVLDEWMEVEDEDGVVTRTADSQVVIPGGYTYRGNVTTYVAGMKIGFD